MNISTDFTYEPGEFRKGRFAARHSRLRGFVPALVLIGFYWLPGVGAVSLMGGTMGVTLVLLMLIVEVILRGQIRRLTDRVGPERSLVFTEESLTVTAPDRSMTLQWSSLAKIQRKAGF
jgi:hypothetical protein